MAASNEEVIQMLIRAYCIELETVANYLAHSINLDGVRAEEIKKSLAADVMGEINHAQVLGARIKQLGGLVPGSLSLEFAQRAMQPTANTVDVVTVINGVIETESAACDQYKKIIRATDGEDYVTILVAGVVFEPIHLGSGRERQTCHHSSGDQRACEQSVFHRRTHFFSYLNGAFSCLTGLFSTRHLSTCQAPARGKSL